jgi:hypothetical protein
MLAQTDRRGQDATLYCYFLRSSATLGLKMVIA